MEVEYDDGAGGFGDEAARGDADDDAGLTADDFLGAPSAVPAFAPLTASAAGTQRLASGGRQDNKPGSEIRRLHIPAHRYTPLRRDWDQIVSPLTEHLKLQVRVNERTRTVELKASEFTTDVGSLQKGADFVQAYLLGFEVQDAVALIRLDDLFVDSFEIKDVKVLHGDHLSRAIGRVAGNGGKTKFAIENATRTRIVLADEKIHILGSFQNIKAARDAVCRLILGAPPGKVFNLVKSVAQRSAER